MYGKYRKHWFTFDGERTNVTAAKLLGADLGFHIFMPKVFSCNSQHENEYLVTPDPCHLIKNVRNAFCNKRVFLNNRGERIE